jgi:hypothetical protein
MTALSSTIRIEAIFPPWPGRRLPRDHAANGRQSELLMDEMIV